MRLEGLKYYHCILPLKTLHSASVYCVQESSKVTFVHVENDSGVLIRGMPKLIPGSQYFNKIPILQTKISTKIFNCAYFPNGVVIRKILAWITKCFKRLDCEIWHKVKRCFAVNYGNMFHAHNLTYNKTEHLLFQQNYSTFQGTCTQWQIIYL